MAKKKRVYRIQHKNRKLVPSRFTTRKAARDMVKLLRDEGQIGLKVVPD
jgi:hypothetical protein